jgi:hypothetical protein
VDRLVKIDKEKPKLKIKYDAGIKFENIPGRS